MLSTSRWIIHSCLLRVAACTFAALGLSDLRTNRRVKIAKGLFIPRRPLYSIILVVIGRINVCYFRVHVNFAITMHFVINARTHVRMHACTRARLSEQQYLVREFESVTSVVGNR